MLAVTGTGFLKLSGAGNDIDVAKLTLTGEGGATYTLTTGSVEITNGTSFSITLNATDKAAINQMLNKDGTDSTGGTTYNLAAAEDWAAGAAAAVLVADLSGNGVTVSNVPAPTITSATYDGSTHVLTVTGTGFLKLDGAANDIDASKFTFTGEGGSHTLTDTTDVDISSSTSFSLTLSAAVSAAVAPLLDKAGTESTGGTIYNLAAAEDWAAGAAAVVNVEDLADNGITVSLNSAPTLGNIPGTTQSILVGQSVSLPDFTVTDTDGDSLTLTLTSTNGTLSGLADTAPGVPGIQLSGSAAHINALLANAIFSATAAGAASISFSLSDGTTPPVSAIYRLNASSGTNTVDDGDDVPDTIEDDVPALPPSNGTPPIAGDGNGDGIKDSSQASVTSLTFLDTDTAVSNPGNAPTTYVSLVADSNSGIPNNQSGTTITHIAQLDAPASIPSGAQMPLGQIAFSVDLPASGITETFSLFVDADSGINSYWKQNADGIWVDIASQVTYIGNKVRIDFSITDGGTFDKDGIANGVIVDPGALGVASRPLPTTAQLVTGLYVGYYDRAPDAEGLAYWINQIDSGQASFEEVSFLFSSHPRFAQEYGSLSDAQFVAALYENILGNTGDSEGLAFWQDQLASHSKSQVVANFVYSALSIDLSAALSNETLPLDDYVTAYQRQSLFDNQVDTGLAFAALGNVTVPTLDDSHLGEDIAYLAAIRVLENISSDYASFSDISVTLAGLHNNPDAMNIIMA